MKYQLMKLLSKGLAPPIFVLICSLLGAGVVHAITPAGTSITNTASVDYTDASTNPFTALSETATVVVGTVYGATIADDELGVTGSPGNQKTIPFTLTNNGNGADTFTITIAQDNGAATPEDNGAGADIDATTFALYHDVNQSGSFDGGDVLIADDSSLSGSLTLQNGAGLLSGFPDNVGALVLVVDVPSSAINTNELGFIITATSVNTTVDDLTASDGFDTLEETVQTLITVTADALLDISKVGAIDAANNRISYTLLVTNNGAAIANDIRLVDQIPANTTFAEMEQINLSTAQGDRYWDGSAYQLMTVGQDSAAAPFPIGGTAFLYESVTGVSGLDTPITAQTIVEPAGVDLNDDGTVAGTFTGLEFLIDALAPTESVSVVYTVDYSAMLAAGTPIENTFCVQGDLDNTAGVEPEDCSNNVSISIPTVYGVSVDDTAGDGTPDTADLTDDEDATDNDTQHEDSAASGETVNFTNVITNNGNAGDSFDLAIDNGATNTFPAGTTFSFFTSGGTPLGTNTGNIAAGGTMDVVVRANLPSVVTGGMATVGGVATVTFDEDQNLFYIESGTDGGCTDTNGTDGCFDSADGDDDLFGTADDEVFFATLTATSANDPAGVKAADTKNESLGYIRLGVADLANSTITVDVNVNADAPDDLSDGIIDDGDASDDKSLNQVAVGTDGGDSENDIITTTSAAPGNTVTFPLFIANEQGASSSFTIGLDTALTPLPNPSWSVVFQPAGGGSSFTSTPVAIPEGSEYALEAVITIPATGTLAPAGDYDFAFKITSNSNANITDTKVDRITITAVCNIDEGTGGTDQIQQLGTVDYAHTISNLGNETQVISLADAISIISAGANGSTGWTSTIRVDTAEDGTVDADYDLLLPGDNITIFDASAAALANVVLGAGNTISLEPGDSLDFEIRVFAPSSADINDQIRVTTTISGGCEAASIIDDTTIALQVRIDKEVAVDPNCTCEENGSGVSAFAQDQTGLNTVDPGQCLIWRLTVTNEGTETASNVLIKDAITPFSVAIPSGDFSATNPSGNTTAPATTTHYQTCLDENAAGSSCQLTGNLVDASSGGTDTVSVSGSNIIFYVGTGAALGTGGSLIGNNAAVGQFCVQVQ